MRILIVEDEKPLGKAMEAILKKHHYLVDLVHDGESGYDYASTGIYDVIILDWMLPKKSGIEILQELRTQHLSTPILLLTAKSSIADKVQGLDSGADDYLSKPFASEELLARLRALTRRVTPIVMHDEVTFGDLTLHTDTLELRTSHQVTLTLKEAHVLEVLMRNSPMVTSKNNLIEKLWGFDSEASDNHVEVYISFLRKKLTYLHSHVQIITKRGIGYVLQSNDEVDEGEDDDVSKVKE